MRTTRSRSRRAAMESPSVSTSRSSRSLFLSRLSNASFHPTTRSDHFLRDLAFLSLLAALVLLFLDLFLTGAILFVGLLTPAWQTFKALESSSSGMNPTVVVVHNSDSEDDPTDPDWGPSQNLTTWQAYWVIAALLFSMEHLVAGLIGKVMPQVVYKAATFAAVSWLVGNRGQNAYVLYQVMVRPVFNRIEGRVDNGVEWIMDQVGGVSADWVQRVEKNVQPWMRKLEKAAEKARNEAEAGASSRRRRRMTFG